MGSRSKCEECGLTEDEHRTQLVPVGRGPLLRQVRNPDACPMYDPPPPWWAKLIQLLT